MSEEAEEICGADTTGDQPCQNPAGDNGRCWIPSHQPDDADDVEEENPHGRPSKLEEYRDDILTVARQGATKEGCARIAGVATSTLYRWLNEYPDFSEAFKRARAQGELKHLQSVNDSGSRFLLERSFGYTKKEEVEVTEGDASSLTKEEKEQLEAIGARDPQ